MNLCILAEWLSKDGEMDGEILSHANSDQKLACSGFIAGMERIG